MIDTSTITPFTTANAGINVGRKFYRNYSLDRTTIAATNTDITGISNIKYIPEVKGILGVNSKFQLKTIYPGLLSGSGYLHEVKNDKEAFKIGFFFDHVTGMPVIPGTGVKGAIRSAFPGFNDNDLKANFNEDGYNTLPISDKRKSELKEALPDKLNKAAFIYCLINNEEVEKLTPEQAMKIHQLEQEIFESKNCDNKPINLYNRDIFHDAVPVEIYNNFRGNTKRLFGSDYITPHKHKSRPELDPFTNPEPIKFLKVMPNVVYEFRFKLNDGTLDAVNKKNLFFKILETLGLGAKTNVGYGQLLSSDQHPNNMASGNQAGQQAQVEVQLAPDEVMAEYAGIDPHAKNNKIFKITSTIQADITKCSIRYAAELKENQKAVLKIVRHKGKIQSFQFARLIN